LKVIKTLTKKQRIKKKLKVEGPNKKTLSIQIKRQGLNRKTYSFIMSQKKVVVMREHGEIEYENDRSEDDKMPVKGK